MLTQLQKFMDPANGFKRREPEAPPEPEPAKKEPEKAPAKK
jgi:hypothetical protein